MVNNFMSDQGWDHPVCSVGEGSKWKGETGAGPGELAGEDKGSLKQEI